MVFSVHACGQSVIMSYSFGVCTCVCRTEKSDAIQSLWIKLSIGSISSASTHNALRSMNSSAQVKLLGSMQTPPVPNLITTSNSSQKLSNGALLHQLSTSNIPPLRPKLPLGNRSSHEIITIGDSPITKNPSPLLSTPSTGLTGLCSVILDQLVQFLDLERLDWEEITR